MTQPIFVRALWGDPNVVTYHKALHDVKKRTCQLPDAVDLKVIAYGSKNYDFLAEHTDEGQLVQLPDDLPEVYHRLGADRNKTPYSRTRSSTLQEGVSMWWRKLEAIRHTMHIHGRPVIWLDFDTLVVRPVDEAMYPMLESGPPLQGCETYWRRMRCPWRLNTQKHKYALHGGLYYIRDLEVIQRAIEVHAETFYCYTDETALTWVMDHEYKDVPCENYSLYRCRKTPGMPGKPYFREGRVIKYWHVKPA